MNVVPKLLLGATLGLAGTTLACVGQPVRGTFDRTLSVSGHARLYLTNGAGSVRIGAGSPSVVHIVGQISARSWLPGNLRQRVAALSQNPPIQQQRNLIRVGFQGFGAPGVRIDYVIELPSKSQVHIDDGSGNLSVNGMAGPVTATTGSGNIDLGQIQGDVQTSTGSGGIHLNAITGSVQANTGSGNVLLAAASGSVRVLSGSGNISVTSPGNTATLRSGSGEIRVAGASSDLRARTGSGTIDVAGSPAAGAYWELRTGTGNVALRVPAHAAFRFDAQARVGNIRYNLPLTVLDKGNHSLSAVVGGGTARVEAQTDTGNVVLNSSGP
jgi:hypothetical protein